MTFLFFLAFLLTQQHLHTKTKSISFSANRTYNPQSRDGRITMSSGSDYGDCGGLLSDGSESSIASPHPTEPTFPIRVQDGQRSDTAPCPCCRHARDRGLERPELGLGLAVLANGLERLALLVEQAVKELGKRDLRELEECLRNPWEVEEMTNFVRGFLLGAQQSLRARKPLVGVGFLPEAAITSQAPKPSVGMAWEFALEAQVVPIEARVAPGPRESSPEMPENWPPGWWRAGLLGTEELPITLD